MQATNAEQLEWRCIQQPHFYLIVCRAGVLELGETIERQLWIHTIDRCLMLKRAIANLTRNMEAVIEAANNNTQAHARGEILAYVGAPA